MDKLYLRGLFFVFYCFNIFKPINEMLRPSLNLQIHIYYCRAITITIRNLDYFLVKYQLKIFKLFSYFNILLVAYFNIQLHEILIVLLFDENQSFLYYQYQ